MTYEYKCESCGHLWEQEQRITDAAIGECPRCHKESAKRLVSGGVGFTLQGSGWEKKGGY